MHGQSRLLTLVVNCSEPKLICRRVSNLKVTIYVSSILDKPPSVNIIQDYIDPTQMAAVLEIRRRCSRDDDEEY